MKLRKAFFLIMVIPFILYGCAEVILVGAGAGAGVATYTYIKGEMKIEYPRPYEEVWRATLAALRDCDITIEQKVKDGFSGKIKARRANGGSVTVKVINKGSGITAVKIRVGTFGNKRASMVIKESIDRHLGIKSKPQ